MIRIHCLYWVYHGMMNPNSLYSTGCKATIFVHVRTLAGNALLIPSHLQAQLDAIRNKCLGCVCVCLRDY